MCLGPTCLCNIREKQWRVWDGLLGLILSVVRMQTEKNNGGNTGDQTIGYLADSILVDSYHGQTDSGDSGIVWVSNLKTSFQIPDPPIMCSCSWASLELLCFGVFPQFNKQLTHWPTIFRLNGIPKVRYGIELRISSDRDQYKEGLPQSFCKSLGLICKMVWDPHKHRRPKRWVERNVDIDASGLLIFTVPPCMLWFLSFLLSANALRNETILKKSFYSTHHQMSSAM